MAAPTAQNSQELHFRFINSFIQPSHVGSLATTRVLKRHVHVFFLIKVHLAQCTLIIKCQTIEFPGIQRNWSSKLSPS